MSSPREASRKARLPGSQTRRKSLSEICQSKFYGKFEFGMCGLILILRYFVAVGRG